MMVINPFDSFESTSEMEGRKNADLLHETRKLLNVLNNENEELKAQNQHLEEELQQGQAAKTKMEADMKKVNLNLMDQLHKRTSACKELEKQLQSLHHETDKESRRSTDSLTRVAALEAENTLLKENIKVLHEQCTSLEQHLSLAEEEAGRSSKQLAVVADTYRSEFGKEQRMLQDKGNSLEATVRSLQQQLAAVSQEKGSLENTFNDLHAEHVALQQAFDTDIAAAKAHSRKAAATEADVSYLRSQLVDTKVEISELLQAMRVYVQPFGDECERNGEELQRLQTQVRSLSEYLYALKIADENVIAALAERLANQQQAASDHQRALSAKDSEFAALEAHAQKLSAQLARYKGEIANLTSVFAELQENVEQSQSEADQYHAAIAARDRDITALNAAVLAEQRLNTDLRLELEKAKSTISREENSRQIAEVELAKERTHSSTQVGLLEQRLMDAHNQAREEARRTSEMKIRYEDEIVYLRSQADEHAATLTNALGKLRSSSSLNHLQQYPPSVPVDSRATSLGSSSRVRSEVPMRPSLLAAASNYRLNEDEDAHESPLRHY